MPTLHKIIILDDHPIYIKGLEQLLKMNVDFRITNTFTSKDKLEAYLQTSSSSFNLVLMDVNLKSRGGFQLLQDLKKEYPDILVFVNTSLCDLYTTHRAFLLGADGFVSKYSSPQLLLDTLSILRWGTMYVARIYN